MLHVTTDVPNTDEKTNESHYNLGMFCMIAGMTNVLTDADREKFVARLLILRAIPDGTTPLEFLRWITSYGAIRTNATQHSDAHVTKRALESAKDDAARALRIIRREEVQS